MAAKTSKKSAKVAKSDSASQLIDAAHSRA